MEEEFAVEDIGRRDDDDDHATPGRRGHLTEVEVMALLTVWSCTYVTLLAVQSWPHVYIRTAFFTLRNTEQCPASSG